MNFSEGILYDLIHFFKRLRNPLKHFFTCPQTKKFIGIWSSELGDQLMGQSSVNPPSWHECNQDITDNTRVMWWCPILLKDNVLNRPQVDLSWLDAGHNVVLGICRYHSLLIVLWNNTGPKIPIDEIPAQLVTPGCSISATTASWVSPSDQYTQLWWFTLPGIRLSW